VYNPFPEGEHKEPMIGGQREERVSAGKNDQAQIERQMIQQVGHLLVDGNGLNEIIIIQHQQERFFQPGEAVNQPVQERFDGGVVSACSASIRSSNTVRSSPSC
jgi:hypothetical protein